VENSHHYSIDSGGGVILARLIIITIMCLFLLNLVSAEYCEQPGYDSCYEYLFTNGDQPAYARIATSIYDARGISYEAFSFSSDAVGAIYLKVLFSGTDLFYFYNLTSFTDICDEISCPGGLLLNGSGVYTLATIGDEYMACPTLVAYNLTDMYDGVYSWAWAALGYIKPENNSCPHIRVNACLVDSDCSYGYFCNRSSLNWRDRFCQLAQDDYESTDSVITYTRRTSPRGIGGSGSYDAKYDQSDLITIAADAFGTTMASIVSLIELLVIIIVISLTLVIFGWRK
jgi:hypothetical protein